MIFWFSVIFSQLQRLRPVGFCAQFGPRLLSLHWLTQRDKKVVNKHFPVFGSIWRFRNKLEKCLFSERWMRSWITLSCWAAAESTRPLIGRTKKWQKEKNRQVSRNFNFVKKSVSRAEAFLLLFTLLGLKWWRWNFLRLSLWVSSLDEP